MELLDLATLYDIKGYFYIVMGGVLVVVFYSYIFHLYRSQYKGTKDYEKYANIALDDGITSKPIEEKSYWTFGKVNPLEDADETRLEKNEEKK